MRVVAVPIAVLLNWRQPDRDIHRLLVAQDRRTIREISSALNLAVIEVTNALSRISRLGLVTPQRVREGTGRHPTRLRWVLAADRKQATVLPGGRVSIHGPQGKRRRAA
jgi:predicted transcriptional regulator